MPAILGLIHEFPDTLMQDNLPPSEAFYVATEGETIVGCCALEIYSTRLAEIRSLAVTKIFQRKGIAKQLIDTCVTEAQKHNVYELLCITGIQGVFERYGFGPFNKEKYALIKILGKQTETS
ncbi:MAG: GNAT family N-acetyltransferase [bacterium]|nr:GNAT family N-acetyltransferase [bacterium]